MPKIFRLFLIPYGVSISFFKLSKMGQARSRFLHGRTSNPGADEIDAPLHRVVFLTYSSRDNTRVFVGPLMST